MKKFIVKSFAYLSVDVLSSIIGLATLLLITNNTPVAVFGFFALLQGTVILVETTSNLQSWQGFVRYSGRTTKANNRYSWLIGQSIKLDVFGSLVGTAVYIPTLIILVNINEIELPSNDLILVMIAGLFFIWKFTGSVTGLLRVNQDYQLINSRNLLVSIIRFLAIWIIVKYESLDIVSLFLVYSISEALGTLYSVSLVYMRYRCQLGRILIASLFHKPFKNNGFNKFCYYSAWSNVFSTATKQIDVVIIGLISSNESVAIFKIIKQISLIFSTLSNPILIMVFPEFSRLISEGRKDRVIHVIDKCLPRLLVIFFSGYLAFYFASPFILSLFGDEYISGRVELLIFIAAKCIAISFGLYHPFLVACGRVKEIAWFNTVNAIFFVLMTVVLVKRLDLLGYVLSFFIYVVFDIIYRFYLYYKIKRSLVVLSS